MMFGGPAGQEVTVRSGAQERLAAKATGGKPRRPGAPGLDQVNAHHQRLKQFVNGKARGVSTKFLAVWLGWSKAVRRPGFDPLVLLTDALVHKFV